MATYVNNLRLTELATGEGSGTWGTTTNTNLELIGEALGYGSEAIANASTHTITVADGTADSARSFYLKLTGGGQACTVTLAPNTLSKVWMVENTTNSTLTFSQGSGANVAIAAGAVKMIATDGAGSGAVVYDLLVDTDLTGTTTVVNLTSSGTIDAATVEFNSLSGTGSVAITDILDQDNMSSDSATALATQQSIKAYVDSSVASFDTLAEVLAQGNTTGSTDIEVTSAQKVQFRDSAIYINSSTDGQLDIVADTEIQIAATTIDINGAINASGEIIAASLDISGNIDVDGTTNLDVVDIDGAVDMASTLQVDGVITTSDGMVITTADNTDTLQLISTDADASVGPNLNLYRNSASPADNDILGKLEFTGRNDNSENVIYAQILANALDVSDGSEDTRFDINAILAGTNTSRIRINNTELVVNEDSADLDFRVESDGNANMLFVDAGNNRVGVGVSSPQTELFVRNDVAGPARIAISNAGSVGSTTASRVSFYEGNTETSYIERRRDGSGITAIVTPAADNPVKIEVNGGNELASFTGSSIVLNESGADQDLRVESDGNTHMLFVDGGNNAVGIGTAPSSGYVFHINAGSNGKVKLAGDSAKLEFDNSGTFIEAGGNMNLTATSTMLMTAGSTNLMTATASAVTFNEGSADLDFRVESDTNANMLFVDASTNRVGINTAIPEATLDVKTELAITEAAAANSTSSLSFYSKFSDSQRGFVVLKAESLASGSSDLVINTRNNFNDTQRLRIAANGKIQISNDIPIWSGSYGGAVFLKGNNATAARNARLCIVDSTGAQDGDKELILDNDGDVTVKGGDLIFGTAGKGIVLGATTNVAANTLDHYEEGNWTPVFNNFSATGTTTNAGLYVKVGNLVYVELNLDLSSPSYTGGGSGTYITGLPFAVSGQLVASLGASTLLNTATFIDNNGGGGSLFFKASTFTISGIGSVSFMNSSGRLRFTASYYSTA